MLCEKIASTILITFLVAMPQARVGEATNNLAATCMPVCMKEPGATKPICEGSCEAASKIVRRNPSTRMVVVGLLAGFEPSQEKKKGHKL